MNLSPRWYLFNRYTLAGTATASTLIRCLQNEVEARITISVREISIFINLNVLLLITQRI